MDINLIEDTIAELEQDVTSFENCEKLASLYICRENYYKRFSQVVNTSESVSHSSSHVEIADVLPAYLKYIDTKRRYQQFEVVDQMLIYAMTDLCQEITEFISDLYNNTETEAERALLVEMINNMRSAI